MAKLRLATPDDATPADEHIPVAVPIAMPEPTQPTLAFDPTMSLAEFKYEAVPTLCKAVAFAGFALEAGKKNRTRREWRELLRGWLQREGFAA